MTNVILNLETQNVEFKFMGTNREVVANKALETSIRNSGIAQDIVVLPLDEFKGELSETTFRFGHGASVGTFVVLDGQHRLTCLNAILAKAIKSDKKEVKSAIEKTEENTDVEEMANDSLSFFSEIPLKIVDSKWLERFGGIDSYIIMLNNTNKQWSKEAFIVNAYQRNEDSMLLRIISKWSEKGMSMSSISRWLSGTPKTINSHSLQRIVKGEEIKGVDSETAIKLYLALSRKGFTDTFLNKRYLADAFHIFKTAGGVDEAILKLSKIKGTSIEPIEKANYKDGDVGNQIKKIINKNFSDWKQENCITPELEEKEKREKTFISTITEADIENFIAKKQPTVDTSTDTDNSLETVETVESINAIKVA